MQINLGDHFFHHQGLFSFLWMRLNVSKNRTQNRHFTCCWWWLMLLHSFVSFQVQVEFLSLSGSISHNACSLSLSLSLSLSACLSLNDYNFRSFSLCHTRESLNSVYLDIALPLSLSLPLSLCFLWIKRSSSFCISLTHVFILNAFSVSQREFYFLSFRRNSLSYSLSLSFITPNVFPSVLSFSNISSSFSFSLSFSMWLFLLFLSPAFSHFFSFQFLSFSFSLHGFSWFEDHRMLHLQPKEIHYLKNQKQKRIKDIMQKAAKEIFERRWQRHFLD